VSEKAYRLAAWPRYEMKDLGQGKSEDRWTRNRGGVVRRRSREKRADCLGGREMETQCCHKLTSENDYQRTKKKDNLFWKDASSQCISGKRNVEERYTKKTTVLLEENLNYEVKGTAVASQSTSTGAGSSGEQSGAQGTLKMKET